MFSLLERKMTDGRLIVSEDSNETQAQALNEVRRVLYPDVAADGDASEDPIKQLLSAKKLENENTDPEEFTTQMIDRIGVGLIKVILSTDRPKKQW